VERLLKNGELEQVPADSIRVDELIEQARKHINSASKLAEENPAAALILAYDSARMFGTALLAHQGLRPTSRGGHIVVVETMNEQFPNLEGLKSIDRLRKRRNAVEYPGPSAYSPVTSEEATEAIIVAEACLKTIIKIIDAGILGVF